MSNAAIGWRARDYFQGRPGSEEDLIVGCTVSLILTCRPRFLRTAAVLGDDKAGGVLRVSLMVLDRPTSPVPSAPMGRRGRMDGCAAAMCGRHRDEPGHVFRSPGDSASGHHALADVLDASLRALVNSAPPERFLIVVAARPACDRGSWAQGHRVARLPPVPSAPNGAEEGGERRPFANL
jgi:hypothetical protein